MTKRNDPAEQDRRQREAVGTDPYANAVVNILSADFPDLRDPVTAGIVRKHIWLAHTGTRSHLEVIVDDPRTANWRLVGAFHARRRVHLGCWKVSPSESDLERVRRLNAALDALEIQ